MVVAQWVVRSRPKPEVRGSNPIRDTTEHSSINCNFVKAKIKVKEAHLKKLLEHTIFFFHGLDFSAAVRGIEPETAESKARTLPLCIL